RRGAAAGQPGSAAGTGGGAVELAALAAVAADGRAPHGVAGAARVAGEGAGVADGAAVRERGGGTRRPGVARVAGVTRVARGGVARRGAGVALDTRVDATGVELDPTGVPGLARVAG